MILTLYFTHATTHSVRTAKEEAAIYHCTSCSIFSLVASMRVRTMPERPKDWNDLLMRYAATKIGSACILLQP